MSTNLPLNNHIINLNHIYDNMGTSYSAPINPLFEISNDKMSTSSLVAKDAVFDGNVTIDGNLTIGKYNITNSLDKIYERLNLLHVNSRLESKWNKLKELGDQYRALEKELLEKEEFWEKMKS